VLLCFPVHCSPSWCLAQLPALQKPCVDGLCLASLHTQ
jgi:hypothetical protein